MFEGYPYKVVKGSNEELGFYFVVDNEGYYVARFYSRLAVNFVKAVEHSMHLTALRRGLALSILFNIILLAVVLATIGGR